ncbi:MAG: recombinase family protein [Moorellales bacterium]
MRAAIYARVSSEEQVGNYSISVQLEAARQVAQARGYEVVGEYVDEGWSGALLDRPALARLMADCRAGLVDVIVVYRIDRFFRDARHLLNTMKELEALGVKFVSATEPFDTATPMGRYLVGQFGLIAEFERTTMLERCRAGRVKRARAGKWFGTAPLGYEYDPATGELVVNPAEAEVVRLAFELYVQPGQSLGTVAAQLNARGLRTKKGRRWSDDAIHDLLTRRLYTGRTVVNVGGAEIPFEAPALVPEELFGRAQELLKERGLFAAYTPRGGAHYFVLAGLVKCGVCGSAMSAGTAKSGRQKTKYLYYYRCWRGRNWARRKGREDWKECGMGWVRAERLEEAVWNAVAELIADPAKVREALEEERAAAGDAGRAEAGDAEARLSALAAQRRALIRAFRDGLLPEEELRRELAELAAEEETLKEAAQRARAGSAAARRVEQFEGFHAAYRETVAALTPKERREILLELVNQVVVRINGTAEIVFASPPGAEGAFTLTVPLGPPDKAGRMKKRPGRPRRKDDLFVSFRPEEWDRIKEAAVAVQRPPTVFIRDAVEEWLARGGEVPAGMYRKWVRHEGLKRRTAAVLRRETIQALKEKSAYSGLPASELVRMAVREKLAAMAREGQGATGKNGG